MEGGAPPPVALGGYYTNGGTVCAADGTAHVFRGVDRPSLEWQPGGDNIGESDFKLMAGWGANVVRIALNQDFWLSGALLSSPDYPATVDQAVKAAEKYGLDVILDLHWSDMGYLGAGLKDATGTCSTKTCSTQQPMADQNSIEFWREVAAKYQGDGHVLFELYNEPHAVTWDVWLHGGQAGGFVAAGMQQLYDAVRGVGANNVVIAGGLNWAFDLSGVGKTGASVSGYNIMYATHPYSKPDDAPSEWESSFGHLETTDFAPVIATEFGDGSTPNCKGDWDQSLIAFMEAHRASWTAWAWYPAAGGSDPQGCHFPSLIVDWNAKPSVQGAVVKAFLQMFPLGPLAGGPDAGEPSADAGDASADDAPTREGSEGGAENADGGAPSLEAGAPSGDATSEAPETLDAGMPGDGSDASDP